ncbi:hypothetical protein B0T22DRAFT_498913 [Podospora appendiculata]|uniref:Uncharacterized protein n=1 Tax=Podospora appendiculata TaxID=314037 RepID=A0AAE0XB79_9PEZI|nr:hypothetical protein B0T22DRAFT_498913 [Podospora appendiculata]
MADAVRPSGERFRAVYENSFRVWSSLYLNAIENPALPAPYLAVNDAFPHHPSFSRNLKLKTVKYSTQRYLYATGRSLWASSPANCPDPIPPFQRQIEISVAELCSILALAWAYILSARWVELLPEPTSIEYTSSQAHFAHANAVPHHMNGRKTVHVALEDSSVEEARWWAAILAPGQGWQATMTSEQDTSFLSPWSVVVKVGPNSTHSTVQTPTSSMALGFLHRLCTRLHMTDQSYAALAALLHFPSKSGRQLHLPPLTTYSQEQQTPSLSSQHWHASKNLDGTRENAQHEPLLESQLDKLLLLGCNTKGMAAMLDSVFYDPSIECNEATPWLQGARSVIDTVVGDNPLVLGRMMMDRLPSVAFLWLGATVLGLQNELAGSAVRSGQMMIDLDAAAWSGTIQSFIQLPVSLPLLAANRTVRRADECHLHFHSQSEFHTRVPIFPWKPFGTTNLHDTDLGYQGLVWDTNHGTTPAANSLNPRSATIDINYEAMHRDWESTSENATRCIFGWLRLDGYSPQEKDIWKHEWFTMAESDDEDEDSQEQDEVETAHGTKPHTAAGVRCWISRLES